MPRNLNEIVQYVHEFGFCLYPGDKIAGELEKQIGSASEFWPTGNNYPDTNGNAVLKLEKRRGSYRRYLKLDLPHE